MIILFFISAMVLVLTLAVGLFYKPYERTRKAVTVLAASLMFISFCGVFFNRFFGHLVEFQYPWAFLCLLFPVAVVGAGWLFRPTFTRQFAFPLTHLRVEQSSLHVLLTRFLAPLCYLLALTVMTIALARPMHLDRTILPPTEGIDIMLVMDMSGSMDNRDFYPSRFIAAQSVASKFVAKRHSDRIGLVVFGAYAMLQAPLTLDHDALQSYIQNMYLGMVDPNSTAIGDALGVGANHLKDSKAKSKVIILLTDGKSNAGTIEPLIAAKAAASYNIRVYTIATASAPGQTLYSSDKDEIDEGLLMEIAKETGGKFYRAKNEAELEQIYNTINELEKTAFAPSSLINRTDMYQPFLFLALILALLAFFLEKLVFIKVP